MFVLDSDFFAASFALKLRIDPRLAVQWACQMLEKGFDTDHLRILAGLDPDQMVREATWENVGKALDELNVADLPQEKACKIYLIYLLKGYLHQIFSQDEVLSVLTSFCNNYFELFMPFYFLLHEKANKVPGYNHPGLYYRDLESFEDLDKMVDLEVKKLLSFLENQNESAVLEQLKALKLYDNNIPKQHEEFGFGLTRKRKRS